VAIRSASNPVVKVKLVAVCGTVALLEYAQQITSI